MAQKLQSKEVMLLWNWSLCQFFVKTEKNSSILSSSSEPALVEKDCYFSLYIHKFQNSDNILWLNYEIERLYYQHPWKVKGVKGPSISD